MFWAWYVPMQITALAAIVFAARQELETVALLTVLMVLYTLLIWINYGSLG